MTFQVNLDGLKSEPAKHRPLKVGDVFALRRGAVQAVTFVRNADGTQEATLSAGAPFLVVSKNETMLLVFDLEMKTLYYVESERISAYLLWPNVHLTAKQWEGAMNPEFGQFAEGDG